MVATSKQIVLLFMIASFASAGFAFLLSMSIGSRDMMVTMIPGLVVGAFFAFKYATFDRTQRKQEEHRKSRDRRRH